jgi:hypothetical protein
MVEKVIKAIEVIKVIKATSVILITIIAFSLSACECNKPKQPETVTGKPETSSLPVPTFNGDSAYVFTAEQVAFGPRVPGTPAHGRCADYLVEKLKSYGLNVIVQQGGVTTFDNKKLTAKNIIGRFNPDNKQRVLLCSHWDSRPFADQDSVRKNEPIDAACDAASGVAVLLELARNLQNSKLAVGVDIIFLDVEDWGQPEDSKLPVMKDSYALGTQYWAKNPHVPGYFASYGILLDMVGAKGAVFYQERKSLEYAPYVVKKVWDAASRAGYGNYFIYNTGSEVIDDHYYINTIANIPTIDIIQYDPTSRSRTFGDYWHTHNDNMSIIDKNTLKAVGQTLLEVLFTDVNL